MNDITEPLQVAVGSHKKGTGFGCAMNVVSWINGDSVITAYPKCSQPTLAYMVQIVNDRICCHLTYIGGEHIVNEGEYPIKVLCAECSAKVIDLGISTIGTGVSGLYNTSVLEIDALRAVLNHLYKYANAYRISKFGDVLCGPSFFNEIKSLDAYMLDATIFSWFSLMISRDEMLEVAAQCIAVYKRVMGLDTKPPTPEQVNEAVSCMLVKEEA